VAGWLARGPKRNVRLGGESVPEQVAFGIVLMLITKAIHALASEHAAEAA
jgi:hypothetical protein